MSSKSDVPAFYYPAAEYGERLDEVLANGIRAKVVSLPAYAAAREASEPMTSGEKNELFAHLEECFFKRFSDQPQAVFDEMREALEANGAVLNQLAFLVNTGGEPELLTILEDVFRFGDLSSESPSGRRNMTCLEAEAMAQTLGFKLMPYDVYKGIQKNLPESERLDQDTESWVERRPDQVADRVGMTVDCQQPCEFPESKSESYIGWRAIVDLPRRAK